MTTINFTPYVTIFNSEEFRERMQDNAIYADIQEEQQQALFVLTHKEGYTEELREVKQQLMQLPEGIVQEIPCQRWAADFALFMQEEEIRAIAHDRVCEEAQISAWDKFQLHTWAVVLFVEAIYRTAIEAVAFAIHTVMPSCFSTLPVEERNIMLQRQWQSLQVLAGVIFSPFDTNKLIEAAAVEWGEDWKCNDSILNIGRGTPYVGNKITASAGTSDFWPLLQRV